MMKEKKLMNDNIIDINKSKEEQQALNVVDDSVQIDKIEEYLPNSFIIWHPRDVVGGDLYFTHFQKNIFTIAVIDCTGQSDVCKLATEPVI